jgi:hypothetical protein
MANQNQFKFVYLGEPPSQKKTTQLKPRNRRGNQPAKIGFATEMSIPDSSSGQIDTIIPSNIDILQEMDVRITSGHSVKAGEIIIAAKPFVQVPATG